MIVWLGFYSVGKYEDAIEISVRGLQSQWIYNPLALYKGRECRIGNGMLTKFVLTHPNIHCRVSRMDRNLIFDRMKTGQIVFAVLLLLLPSVLPCILSPCWHATSGNYVSCMCSKCCYPGIFGGLTCCGQLDCFNLCFNTDH